MSYYDDKKKVAEYIRMAQGFDGRELIAVLKQYLPPEARLLELGMGPGKDLDLLRRSYYVAGSDSSQEFLALYRKKHPDADLLLLDARTLNTDRKFDGIYSNKVLIHLTQEELQQSFARQAELLNPSGILLHSFWYGDSEEVFNGLRFRYYTPDILRSMVEPLFEVLEIKRYTEMEKDDSLYLVLKKKA